MDHTKLASLLFPNVNMTVEQLEEKYPARALSDGARVTRFAPSPTGYLHLGGLFGALTDVMTAHLSGGVAYLRIEDTDKKREIDSGVDAILSGLSAFGVNFDEGVTGQCSETGDYGPYMQSKRVFIYHVVAKALVEKGLAYPCFCTEEQLAAMRTRQESESTSIWGYFGKWAACRDLTYEQIEANINAGMPWVLRLRSNGDESRRVAFDDQIRGRIEMPENIIDEVLLKSDGVPTYHFAHACDDHFMRTTHVIRGEEWISSTNKHIALFSACGFKLPKYAHTPVIMKIDENDGTKRKLSKRKDPEAAVSYFVETGFPKEALIDYLLTLMNSGFEDWRRANPTADAFSFPFNLKKMSVSGCLFDMAKLRDVSKNVISLMDADTVYDRTLEWAKVYDTQLASLLQADPAKAKAIFAIGRGGKKPRKDFAVFSEVKNYIGFFYDELFTVTDTVGDFSAQDVRQCLDEYLKSYNEGCDANEWFASVKAVADKCGFCSDMKAYKADPSAYKGSVADVSTFIRVAVTGRQNSPDLYSVIGIIGKDEMARRINKFAEEL